MPLLLGAAGVTPLLFGAASVAAGTWFGSWAALPITGALVGAWQGRRLQRDASATRLHGSLRTGLRARLRGRLRGPAPTAALAGVLGWAVLLLAGAARGPVVEVARLAGGVLGGLPSAAFLAVALLFAGLLAGAAGGACGALVQLATARPAPSSPERD